MSSNSSASVQISIIDNINGNKPGTDFVNLKEKKGAGASTASFRAHLTYIASCVAHKK